MSRYPKRSRSATELEARDAYNKALGVIMLQYRLDAGLHTGQVAKVLNVARTTIGNIERGQTAWVPLYRLQLLLDIYDLTLSQLVSDLWYSPSQDKKGRFLQKTEPFLNAPGQVEGLDTLAPGSPQSDLSHE